MERLLPLTWGRWAYPGVQAAYYGPRTQARTTANRLHFPYRTNPHNTKRLLVAAAVADRKLVRAAAQWKGLALHLWFAADVSAASRETIGSSRRTLEAERSAVAVQHRSQQPTRLERLPAGQTSPTGPPLVRGEEVA